MSDLNIGKVIIDQTKTSQVTVNYADTSKPDTSTITSNKTQMTATVDSISTVFEVSKTYYFDADGGLVTTNQGYGTLGTTDSDGVLTVAHSTPSLQDFRIEESESEYRVAEDIHFTAYVNYGNLPSIWTVYAQYSSDGITYEDIQSATVGGSGLANITGCLIPAGASGTIYLRARVGDVYSDPIEALVVVPEIVISAVDVTVDEAFTISGTCNLAKNLRISYAKDPYSSWTVVDNSVTVQPNGTWSVDNVVISETGNFRLKAEYIQDAVSMFSDTDDVVVASGIIIPVDELYDSFDVAVSSGHLPRGICNGTGANDIIITATNPSFINTTFSGVINTDSESIGTLYQSNGSFVRDIERIDANFIRCTEANDKLYQISYIGNSSHTNITPAGSFGNIIGITLIGGVVHLLFTTNKLYSCNADFSTLTLKYDFSALGWSGNLRITFDETNQIFYVSRGNTLTAIDWATGNLIDDIAMTDSLAGIVHHKGRIHYITVKSATVWTVKILKNSDDA